MLHKDPVFQMMKVGSSCVRCFKYRKCKVCQSEGKSSPEVCSQFESILHFEKGVANLELVGHIFCESTYFLDVLVVSKTSLQMAQT